MEQRAGKARIQYFFNLNCKSEYVMYPVELVLCEVKYVGKPKMACNVIFFFLSGFFFRNIYDSQDIRARGRLFI